MEYFGEYKPCYNGTALYIEGDDPPNQEGPKAQTITPDGVNETHPIPRDSDKSSECQEVDYDTDFEYNVSDTEQGTGTETANTVKSLI